MKRIGGDVLLSGAAALYRRLCRSTRFVAVTGSAGKSTARHLLSEVLASRFATNSMVGTANGRGDQARVVLRTRRHHRFTVMEVGTKYPGTMRRAALAFDPDVVAVLNVLPMHSNRFPSLDHMAREKSMLLRRLTSRGVAVLSHDDPRTRAMADGLRSAVWTFGTAPEADVWASDVTGSWPERLSFDLHFGAATERVQTRLVGKHWVNSVLAAVCAGLACGVELEEAVRTVERVPPVHGRLQPVKLPGGAVILRDDYNASVSTYEPALAVLERARGVRRVAVVGDTWDSGLAEGERLARLGAAVGAAADLAVFVGTGSEVARRAAFAAGLQYDSAYAFASPHEAAAFVRRELRPDDLVLLKGQWIQHLERIYWAQLGVVSCRRVDCSVLIPCQNCGELRFAGPGPKG